MSSLQKAVYFLISLTWLVTGSGNVACHAAEDPPKPGTALGRLEFVEMFNAVAKGSQMGPNDGWFHPGQTRYDWKWLAARHGVDPKGSISRNKFLGPVELFDRLDRNHDGVLKADDLDWSRSPMASPPSFWFSMYDTNSNGRLSREEWNAIFEKASKGKSYLTADDLRDAFPLAPPPRPAGSPPPTNQGPTTATLMQGLFNGELGSCFEGPSVGQRAPDFTLRTADGKSRVTLAEFRDKKPVVLIFGSFT